MFKKWTKKKKRKESRSKHPVKRFLNVLKSNVNNQKSICRTLSECTQIECK